MSGSALSDMRLHEVDSSDTRVLEEVQSPDDGAGKHGQGARVQGMRVSIPEHPESSHDVGPGVNGDAADEWFRQAAAARNQTLAEFQREAGILTKHQERQIRAWEVPLREQVS